MDKTTIKARLVEIDIIFIDNADNDEFYKTDRADRLRSEWLFLYNLLARQ